MKTTFLSRKKARTAWLFMSIALLWTTKMHAQVKMAEEEWTMPTYEVLPAEKAPMFYTGGSFQGARRIIYPYALNDEISHKRVMKKWKALTLENEYIRLGVTPEIGGKLYYAMDKSNNFNFVYKNNEVKPSNIGMTGAWVSGGIEWCVLHHHRASTMLPMDYSMVENADGSKTIFIGETEPRHRMRWTVAITVRPGKSYVEAELSIYNPTPYTNTFLYWANVAAHTNDQFQTIFPPSVQMATFHSKTQFTHWPISTEFYREQDFTSGVDVSWWKNVKKNASFFAWNLQEDFMGGYDHGKNAGTVHIGDHNIVKGAKLWEWGSGPRGQATEGRLTETSGPYVEIMVGAFSDNQPDYTWIRPYEVKRWKQYWYPVRDIDGFKNANLNGAVNLEMKGDDKVFLGYYSTEQRDHATVVLKKGDKVVFEKKISISPKKGFAQTISLPSPFALTDLYTALIDDETGEELIAYQPKEYTRPEKLPDPVTPPPAPEEIKTVEELFVTGSRLEQFYKIARPYYDEALKRDPGDIRTNTAVGNQYLRNGDYITARKYFSRAIRRLTTDYIRPSSCEALYLQGLTLRGLGLTEAAKDTLYRATWDYAYHSAAYFQLAQISCEQGDFDRALEQIDASLSTNQLNARVIALKASILRKLGRLEEAKLTLQQIHRGDPLDFRSWNERYLIAEAEGQSHRADSLLQLLEKRMRAFDQNYLEVAAGYLNEGQYDEAGGVLARFDGESALVNYYLGYVADKKGNRDKAGEYFERAAKLPVDYVFPFRLETLDVLKVALQYVPDDGKALYYMGNILYDKQPEKAIDYWEQAVQKNASISMAYRNLGWGYYRHDHDVAKAIPYYEKAIALDGSSALFFTELDKLYELNNTDIATRLKIFEGNEEVVRKRDDSFVRMVTVLTLAGQADQSVSLLKGKQFSYREGTSRVRETIIDAHLVLGIDYLKNKKYEKALDQFLLAQVPEEEAGSARYGNREIQVDYFIGQTYKAMKDKQKAREYFQKSAGAPQKEFLDMMDYYRGLSLLALNQKSEAASVFNKLVEEGRRQLQEGVETENSFFAIFGEKEAENARKSMAHTLIGLGQKGQANKRQAKDELTNATSLSVSNLWAQAELSDL